MTADAPDVLVLTPHVAPPPGGIQRFATDIADALDEQRVRIVGVSEGPVADPRVHAIVQRPGALGAAVATVRYATAAVAGVRRRPKVVQAMTWRAALPALLVPSRAPVVLYCHGAELLRARGSRLRRFALRRVTAVVANSQFTANLVREVAGREAHVIHPPVGAIPSDVAARARAPRWPC